MTLRDVKEGESARIIGFTKDCEAFKNRMQALGFALGDVVHMERNSLFAPIKISSNQNINSLAICKGQAEKILVKKI